MPSGAPLPWPASNKCQVIVKSKFKRLARQVVELTLLAILAGWSAHFTHSVMDRPANIARRVISTN